MKNYKFSFFARALINASTHLSKAYIYSQKHHLEKYLVPFFGRKDIRKITYFEVRQYLSIHTKKRKVYDDIKFFKQVLNTARHMGVKKVPKFKIENTYDSRPSARQYIDPKQFKKILLVCDQELRLQLNMGYTMGMRKSEIFKFRFDLIDHDDWIYLPPNYIKTKMRDNRRFPCNEKCLKIIRRRQKKLGGEYLFPSKTGGHVNSNKSALKTCISRCGFKFTMHDLRHSAITNMLIKGVPAQFVSIMLGVSEKVMRRYTHVPKEYAQLAVNGRKKVA